VNTWKAIFAAIVIFGAGIVAGGALVSRLHSNWLAPAHPASDPASTAQVPSPGGMRLEFLRRAQRDLDLTPEQRERIDKILKDSQERTRKLMEPIAPEFHAESKRAREEFRAVLTPQQQERFDQLVKLKHGPRDERHPSFSRDHAPAAAQTNQPQPSN
jgi:Spy/CpxP family protein refolding chaperone